MSIKRILATLTGSSLIALAMPVSAIAAPPQVIVTPPVNSQGWSTNDTTPDATVSFVADATAPGNPHTGALRLATSASTSSKAQYFHAANVALSTVNELSYYTKQITPPGPVPDPAYQLTTLLNGTSGYTNLVFEPYQNPGNNGNPTVANNVWQKWDVATGLFWSTRTVTCSNGVIAGTPGGPASYTLADIKAACPSANVVAFGVNIGSNNPLYDVRTDLVNFNGTTYNFEPYQVANEKDQCKKDGYKNVTDANGNAFKNQGQCVSFVNHNHGDKDHNDKDKNDDHQDGESND